MDSPGRSELVANLEKAAQIVMSPPGVVRDIDRRAAENYFMELKSSTKSPLVLCQEILETSANEFVVFECVSAVKESTLREWVLLDSEVIENIWKYLLNYVTQRPGLPGYVTAEVLQAISMIMKRGTFDTKTGDTDHFYSSIDNMISNNDSRAQSLACQALLSLCTEHCTSWRSSDVGMTWDFHIRAKRHFEGNELKRVLQMSLRVLYNLVTTQPSGRDQIVLYNRFLCVAEAVLTWHFGSRMLPKRLTYSIEFSATAALRPPASWKDVFLDEKVLSFFFQLHSQVRHNQELAHHSMQCLIQLSSLMGDIFNRTEGSKITSENTHDHYVAFIVKNINDLFANGPTTHEVLNVSIMISKLLSYHPLPCILRLPKPILEPFLRFLVQLICQLCTENMKESMTDSDDTTYHEALARLFDSWAILIRSEGRILPDGFFREPTKQIFDAFLHSIMSPPFGSRPKSNTATEDEIEDLDEDDRDSFQDLFVSVACFGRYSLSHTLTSINKILSEKLALFGAFLASAGQNGGISDISYLSLWHEDIHWLLLLIGYTLAGEDCDGSCYVNSEIVEYSSSCNNKLSLDQSRAFLLASIANPESLPSDENTDPVIKLIGTVFVWSVLEHRLLLENQLMLLSPQLCKTTLWCLRRLTSAYTTIKYGDSRPDSPNDQPCVVRQSIETGSELSQLLVNFLLQKCFTSLLRWTGELLIARDALQLLISMVDDRQRANEVANSPCLLEEVMKLDIQKLIPGTRKELLKSLVLIGAATEDDRLREQMYMMILDPLAKRFDSLMSNLSEAAESDLLDIIDCFGGVAAATQIHSAVFLFKYLMPILEVSLPLIVTFKDRQTVVDGVLQFFTEITKKLAIYLDNDVDTNRLYTCLLNLLKIYSDTQVDKYKVVGQIEEEDKASDLVLVLEILSNILSKDVLILASVLHEADSEETASAARVTMTGLEMIMPLMNTELLKFPNLASKFFTLLLYMTEMYPETVIQSQGNMVPNLLKSAHLGLSSEYGPEVLRVSLEIIGVIATFVVQSVSDSTNQIKAALSQFIKTSCEVDAFSEATFSLFSLICCNQETYNIMVNELINGHTDSIVRSKLEEAFQKLLQPNAQVNLVRQEKRQFRERFELFLNDICGLLCIKR